MIKKINIGEDESIENVNVDRYFEKHWLIKKFGAEIMNQPAKDVEAISVIEEVMDFYEGYKMRETNYKLSQKENKKWH